MDTSGKIPSDDRRETAEPQLVELSSVEEEWLGGLLATAESRGLLKGIDTLGEAFEAEREDWAAQPAHRRPEPGRIIRLYAVAFGQLLAMEHDLDWVGLKKSTAVEIVLWGGPGENTLLPISMVEKRWHDPAVRSLEDLYRQTAAGLGN
ncbi:hypothetical protein COCCU_13390 [Corynebacterium occultum]|uniref:Uncharacterized protein n=1 Tax=Corynebacterium occultum TaxID=2675219 RepID=A0A6B8W9E0_9CORY|nr:DUF3806 domain-containing protein [Corynebacterium occultum]QGU08577.1 hypothetical protein COCCU_13390 [Corynebacterium occultum]